ncbi:TIGR03943 family putative permease subunit [Kutzneria chonburiensis]|uniref:TIGR03943 family putative permease subunit n=1 Tax=Kutzneria chonburiensis TaxID=1483604 RepID=A0ABV6N567_9PSEU|nr:TIGR03943 family protein [Kutzneria chonburiensis]
MRRETQNILLVLLGGALLKIALNGTYLNYVKPGLQPWLIVSGTVMVVLAGVAIATDILKARRAAHASEIASTDSDLASSGAAAGVAVAEHDHPRGDLVLASGHAHDDGHGHSHGAARSAWMLLMPVLAIFLIAPPALGADSVNRAGGRTVASEQRQDQVIKTKFPPLPAGAVVPMRMADVATRAAWDATNSLNGRTLELTGFVVHDAAGVYVARLVITCCAADAMPVKARLVGVEGLADDQWITVTGQVRPDSAVQADNYVPVFDTATVKKIGTPSDPYEY